jgi:hypothetical protein
VDGRLPPGLQQARRSSVADRWIDHVILLTADLDRAAAVFSELGFCCSPRMFHPFGTANHLVMFGGSFLELLGIADPNNASPLLSKYRAALERRPGLTHVAYSSFDAAADRAQLAGVGVMVGELQHFRRRVLHPSDPELFAEVTMCPLEPNVAPGVLTFFSQQHVPEAIWIDAWQRQPNGVCDIEAVIIVTDDADAVVSRLQRETGSREVRQLIDRVRIETAMNAFELLTPSAYHRAYAEPPGAGETHVAGLRLKVASVQRAAQVLEKGRLPWSQLSASALLIPASTALGALLLLEE